MWSTGPHMNDRISWDQDATIHAYWAIPGQVLAGEYPVDPGATRSTTARLGVLLDAGVRTFIDLTENSEGLEPYEATLRDIANSRGLEITRVSFPIPDGGALPADSYDTILSTIDEATSRGGVFVHGREGLGRPGTVVGCIFAGQGLSYEGSLRTLKERRMYSSKADTRAPSTFAQRDVIAQHAARH